MPSLEELTRKLIDEFMKPKGQWLDDSNPREGSHFRGFISTDDRRQIILSKEMEQLIREIAAELRKLDGTLAVTHTDDEWNQLVRGSLGEPLGSVDPNADSTTNARSVIEGLQARIDKSLPKGSCEHVYGCNLFGIFDVGRFSIGPVTFQPRVDWLSLKVREGEISRTSERRILSSWSHAKLSKRKPSDDAYREASVIKAIGDCRYVCCVQTHGLAFKSGQIKAQKAAHMALTAIALSWENPSRALDGFRLFADAQDRINNYLVFKPGLRMFSGSQRVGLPHGPSISAGEWLQTYGDYKHIYEVIGQSIEYFLSTTGTSPRPKLMSMLMQALLLFYEACREEVDLFAIVKFVSSLDALANGGKSGGIKKLINSRLNIKDDQPIRENGPTLKAAIEDIYGGGRSRTLHGTNEKFSHDWSSTRRVSEAFARHCLILSVGWMIQKHC